jgi:hypothetical protein
MNSNSKPECAFPLSGGTMDRPALRAPRLASLVKPTPGVVMGNRAFLRAWAARRAVAASAAASANPFPR